MTFEGWNLDGPLSGCPISRELAVNDLSGTDSFVISTPLNGAARANFYRSKRVSYDTIRNDIYGALFDDFNLGTMATEASSDYSPRVHDHFGRYSVVSVEQHYFRNPSVAEADDQVIVLGHVVVNGTSYDICTPKIDQGAIKAKPPDIGTLKFVALPNMPQINENSDDFDGWVYPDGRDILKTRFPDAFRTFGYKYGKSTELTFKLPVLSNFIEMNPYVQPNDAIQEKRYNIGMKQHGHDIDQVEIQGTFSLEGEVKNYWAYNKKGSETNEFTPPGYHHGSYVPPNGYIKTQIDFDMDDIKVTLGDSKPNQAVDQENYPRHTTMPVLMYIGEPAT